MKALSIRQPWAWLIANGYNAGAEARQARAEKGLT